MVKAMFSIKMVSIAIIMVKTFLMTIVLMALTMKGWCGSCGDEIVVIVQMPKHKPSH